MHVLSDGRIVRSRRELPSSSKSVAGWVQLEAEQAPKPERLYAGRCMDDVLPGTRRHSAGGTPAYALRKQVIDRLCR